MPLCGRGLPCAGKSKRIKRRMIKRLPPWFRQEIPRNIHLVRNRLRDFENHKLNTVCLSAHCPNINACFENNSVTFMLLGNICSRNCNFCAVEKGNSLPLALLEPYELALTARRMNLRYAVITSVTRDDLSSGGATQYARAVYLTRRLNPEIKIELLIPDFKGSKTALGLVVKSRPDIIGHNLETAQGLYAKIRPLADYQRSLTVLRNLKGLGFDGFIKSGIMLGLGETESQALEAVSDLKNSGCDILTLGQYLAPLESNFPVKEFVSPERFEYYCRKALAIGFKAVYSGPLVRSSYRAQEVYAKIAC